MSSHSFDWRNDEELPEFLRSKMPVSVDALEKWLENNHSLWKLGVHLASTAHYYRSEYKHIPFNKSGWFNPN